MKQKTLILIIIAVFCGCLAGCTVEPVKLEATPVSFVEVIAHPERNSGESIAVKGVLREEAGGYCLYYSRLSAKYSNPLDGIWLGDLSDIATPEELEAWDTWYVEVIGIADHQEQGPDGAYSSGIRVHKVDKLEQINKVNYENPLGEDIVFE